MHKNVPVLMLLIAMGSAQEKTMTTPPGQEEIEKMATRFSPTPLLVDISKLSSGDHKALVKLVQAARNVNQIFLQQLWSGNAALYRELQRDTSPLGQARLHYFW